jgi:hypothetical protein
MIYLAARGWQVTGIDIVPKALRAARRLRAAGVGSCFNFILDFGAIHGLAEAQRKAAGREICAVTATGGSMLILAWIPAHRGPLPRGMSREQILDIFPNWKIIREEAADVRGAPGFIQRAEARFYRLRYQ